MCSFGVAMMALTISADDFYGKPTPKQLKLLHKFEKSLFKPVPTLPYISNLTGPSQRWEIFRKQSEAIAFAKSRGSEIMSFAFEDHKGSRLFLSCDPAFLWLRMKPRPAKERCTYEIIQENSLCKLYLDIEFMTEFNKNSNGLRMINSLQKILIHEIFENFNVTCTLENILDLESRSLEKFSHHLIFQLPCAAFKNNLVVGNFVKHICSTLRRAEKDPSFLKEYAEATALSQEDILELFIYDCKGNKRLFIDEGVYTKNRHFRLLNNTKLHKQSPLLVAINNKFLPEGQEEDSMFLSSLVTFFKDKPTTVLEFGVEACAPILKGAGFEEAEARHRENLCTSVCSIDDFLREYIAPHGRIRKRISIGSKYYYDVTGYRYCGNVGREHRSNNVRLVIDTERLILYQTCYDHDCKGYSSPPVELPSSIIFDSEEDNLMVDALDSTITNDDLIAFIEDYRLHNIFDPPNTCELEEDDDDVILSIDGSHLSAAPYNSSGCGPEGDERDNSETGISDDVLVEAMQIIEHSIE